MRQVYALLLMAVVLCGCADAETEDGETTSWNIGAARGRCVVATLGADGTLTVSGKGDMRSFVKHEYTISWNPGHSDQHRLINNSPWREYADAVTKIIIEDGVTSISDRAFYDCKNLKSITMLNPNPPAIARNVSLRRIDIYRRHTLSLGINAKACTLYVPKGREEAYRTADYWKEFKNIRPIKTADGTADIPAEKTSAESGSGDCGKCCTNVKIDGVLYSRNLKVLIGCQNCKEHSETITIPDGVKTILLDAFKSCDSLTTINIPKSVTKIEIGDGWREISFPVNLKEINVAADNKAYRSADGILYSKGKRPQLIRCPMGKAGIVTIPDGVVSIRDGAFRRCIDITSISIPNSVTRIGASAFETCTELESVAISNRVTKIEWESFYNCMSLQSVIIPDSVTVIHPRAFEGCRNLESLTIGASVKYIGFDAFTGCKRLKSITVLQPIPPIYNLRSVFRNYTDYATCALYVPKGSEEAYRTSEVWKVFKNIRPIE
jgi:hypothetical protein